ncbi:hypothetical protein VTO42DRAFT_4989 [Malbranchea cinnamomea]
MPGAIEASPLTQQTRPDTFQPKIVQLYETLFLNQALLELSEGFWREFFLLPPDRSSLSQILNSLSPDDVLHIHPHTRQLLKRAIQEIASAKSPSNLYALDTLTILLGSVLAKKYTNPTSDVIVALAGLEEVDQVVSGLVTVLDGVIRNGQTTEIRLKAITAALAMTSGAYKTSLLSYLMQRDLFPSLMKFMQDSESQTHVFEPFLLLGLLANYNKFEFQNPYQLRLDDFVNEAAIQKIVKGAGTTCALLRNAYVAVQDDLPEGWHWSSTLAFFGLGALVRGGRSSKQQLSPEEAAKRFAMLPSPEAAILLSMYDFINSNKLFGYSLVSVTPEKRSEESPFASFLSLSSYLLQHAYRSTRVSQYGELALFCLRVLLEDPVLCKQMCSDEHKRSVRLCRQRPPHLPLINGDRVLATVIIDMMIDTINHNLRRALDVSLYSNTLSVILRLLTYLSSNKTRLTYHWPELWRAFLTLTRFLTTYAADFSSHPQIHDLTSGVIDLIAFCISAGDTFLPDPSSYDDLFYKVVEAGPVFTRFRDVYKASASSPNSNPGAASHATTTTTTTTMTTNENKTHSIDTLIDVSNHFRSLLFLPEKQKSGDGAETSHPAPQATRKKNLSPREVHEIIKQGYDTLSIRPQEGLGNWEKWRETDRKFELKRIARLAVEDARSVVMKPNSVHIIKDATPGSGGHR